MVINNSISVILVTYNNQDTINSCLISIIKNDPNVEIVIIDNNSIDKTVQIIRKIKHKITLIESNKNFGFSSANNLGVKSATGDYLVFLNPDTKIIQKNNLNMMVKVLKENPQFGLVGPELIYSNGQIQMKARNLPTVWRAFQEYVLEIKGAYDFYQPVCRDLCEVESVTGACMVIKKSLFQKVGGFDEKYFLYYEDLDLCNRIRKAGLKIGYLPQIKIEHSEGVSGKGENGKQLLIDSAKKFHGLFHYFLIYLIIRFFLIKRKIIS